MDSDTDRRQVTTTPIVPRGSLSTRTKVVAGIVAAVLIVAAAGVTYLLMKPSSSDGFTAHGSVTITNPMSQTPTYEVTSDGGCQGAGGYSDLAPGAMVQVADGTGHILGTGALAADGKQVSTGGGVYGCQLTFTLPNLSAADTYVLTVGSRSPTVETSQQMRDGVDLTIGS